MDAYLPTDLHKMGHLLPQIFAFLAKNFPTRIKISNRPKFMGEGAIAPSRCQNTTANTGDGQPSSNIIGRIKEVTLCWTETDIPSCYLTKAHRLSHPGHHSSMGKHTEYCWQRLQPSLWKFCWPTEEKETDVFYVDSWLSPLHGSSSPSSAL